MNNAVKIIKNDHKIVKDLFNDYKALGDEEFEAKNDTASEICRELTLHADMEEAIMYPKLKVIFDEEGVKLVEEAYAEHEVMKELISRIEGLNSEDEQFDAKIIVLEENTKHHIEEEEQTILPKMEQELSEEELMELGDELEAYKKENTEV